MKKSVFLALLLLPALFAAQTPMQKFLNSSFEPDQSVSARPLSAAGAYYLVTADGAETYVVNADTGIAIREKAALQGILAADAFNRSSFASKAEAALGLDEAILAAKDGKEKKCIQYLGLDMHPCSDRESCILSCFSVPQCVGGPLYSDGFLEAFMEWNAGRQKFDSLVLEYSDSQERMTEDTALIDSKMAVLDELAALSPSLSKNPIFLNRSDEGCSSGGVARCYEYCPKIDYSAARIAAGKANLAALKAALTDLKWQPLRAEGILNRSGEQDKYLASRGRLYEELRLAMQKEVRNLTAQSESLSKKVWDKEVDSLIASLSNYSAGVIADADAGLYRKALSKAPAFYGKARAISDRMAADEEQYGLMASKFGSVEEKIVSGAWLLGNSTAEDYLGELSQIKSNASAPVTLREIESAKEKADALKERVADEIAAKATEQGGKKAQLPVKLPLESVPSMPCPIAAGMVAIIAFAFARHEPS